MTEERKIALRWWLSDPTESGACVCAARAADSDREGQLELGVVVHSWSLRTGS